jgi:hypothetical protein
MWNMSCIFIDVGRSRRYTTDDTFSLIGNGPYYLGDSFCDPLMVRFFPSNHTCCPSVKSHGILLSFACCIHSNCDCASCLASTSCCN